MYWKWTPLSSKFLNRTDSCGDPEGKPAGGEEDMLVAEGLPGSALTGIAISSSAICFNLIVWSPLSSHKLAYVHGITVDLWYLLLIMLERTRC